MKIRFLVLYKKVLGHYKLSYAFWEKEFIINKGREIVSPYQ